MRVAIGIRGSPAFTKSEIASARFRGPDDVADCTVSPLPSC